MIFWDNLENPWFNPWKSWQADCEWKWKLSNWIDIWSKLVVKAWVALHQEPQPVYIIYIYMCIDRYMRTYIHIYIYIKKTRVAWVPIQNQETVVRSLRFRMTHLVPSSSCHWNFRAMPPSQRLCRRPSVGQTHGGMISTMYCSVMAKSCMKVNSFNSTLQRCSNSPLAEQQ